MSSTIDSKFSNSSPSGDFFNKSNGIVFTISAPGKVILHGEHSVVYGKLALAVSLGLRTSVTLRENEILDDSSVIEANFPDVDLHYAFDFKEIKNLLDKPLPIKPEFSTFDLQKPECLDHDLHSKNIEGFLSATYKYQNLNRIQKNSLISFLYLFTAIFNSLNVKLRPFHFSVSSQLSIGAGTGSSASFTVCLVASFLHYAKALAKKGRVDKSSSQVSHASFAADSDSLFFTEEELRVCSDWGYVGEKIHHGNPSGIDNTICTYGGLLAFTKGCPPLRKTMTYPLQLLLINTKVPRDTKSLVIKAAEFLQKFPSVGQGILTTMDEISKTALNNLESLNENPNQPETFKNLEELSEINHSFLRILGVSHPTLEKIVKILKTHGLKGKLTGAGGGGYATCILPPCITTTELEEVLTDLSNDGFDVKMTTLGDGGVRVDC